LSGHVQKLTSELYGNGFEKILFLRIANHISQYGKLAFAHERPQDVQRTAKGDFDDWKSFFVSADL
jgi:hypothetical protein